MNWEAIGAIAEVIGAVAVIATLIYLGVEIRQNTRMMKASIRQELARASVDLVMQFASHARAFANMQQRDMPIWDSPAEELEAEWLTTSAFRSWEAYAWQHAAGLVDTSEWNGILEDIKYRATFPYYVDQWRRTRSRYSPRLREAVDPLFGVGD